MNAGLLCLYSEDIEKNDFLSLIRKLMVLDSVYFAEQVAICFILSRHPHKNLPKERYVPCYFHDSEGGKGLINDDTVHLHFMGNKKCKVNDLYQYYANRVFDDLLNPRSSRSPEKPAEAEIVSEDLKVSEKSR